MVAPTVFKLKFEQTDKPQFTVRILDLAHSLREVRGDYPIKLILVGEGLGPPAL